MVKAVLTTTEGKIVQRTFADMKGLTDHLEKNPGLYAAIDARVFRRIRDIRQGRDDRTATRP